MDDVMKEYNFFVTFVYRRDLRRTPGLPSLYPFKSIATGYPLNSFWRFPQWQAIKHC